MIEKERVYLRELQNKVAKNAYRMGFTKQDGLKIYNNLMKEITLEDIELYLYPEFKGMFEDALK